MIIKGDIVDPGP